MKSTGIVRKIDELGRIVIPKEMRNVLEIKDNDPVEISLEGSKITLSKLQSCCTFCAATERLTEFRGKKLCLDCLSELKKEAEF